MDEVLVSTLQAAVIGRLDYLDTLITDADEPSRAALAETELSRLTAGWRALLAEHQPDEHGRCPQCSGWRRGHKFPCSVWVIAHQHLIAADGSSRGRARQACGCRRTADRRGAGGLMTGGRAVAPNTGAPPVPHRRCDHATGSWPGSLAPQGFPARFDKGSIPLNHKEGNRCP
ncbi:MAG: hypothetical protein ACRDRP_09635 [Pseudonocardiaceae bacterium]